MSGKTELFAEWLGGNMVIANQGDSTGTRFYVHSVTGTDAAGWGNSPEKPVATLDYAIGLCTTLKHDIIYIVPGHAETYTTTGTKCTFDVIGVRIVGLGQGSNRATFTFTHTGATFSWTAASMALSNVLLVCGVDSVVTPLTISGADATLTDVEWRDAANVEFITGLTTAATADRLTIIRPIYTGDAVTGNACVRMFSLVGIDNGRVVDGRFSGIASIACVGMVTTASTNLVVDHCSFNNIGTALSKNVVNTGGLACTWEARDCFDMVGGYRFSGGNGRAVMDVDAYTVAAVGAGGITAASFGADAIDAASIATGAIVAATFAAGAIDAAAIAAGAIDAATFAAGAIDAAAIAAGAIDAATFAAGAIDAAAIANDAIDATAIADGAIDAATFAAGAITAAAIATGAVDADAIAADTILGADNANNAFASTSVVANLDGSLIERLEYIQRTSERSIEKTDGACLTGDDALFTITGGPIMVTEFVGVVTTAIGGASTMTINENVTTPAGTVALSSTVAIDADAGGTSYTFTAAAPGVLTPATPGALANVPAFKWLCPIGQIVATGSAAQDGVIHWYMSYKPLTPSSVVVMAA